MVERADTMAAAIAYSQAREDRTAEMMILVDSIERRVDATFREEDHPRAGDGKFSSQHGTLGKAELTTSQHFIDEDIVSEKIKSKDFDVAVSPKFIAEDKLLRVVLDGHHSLAAAIRSGEIPNFIEHEIKDNDNLQLLKDGDIEGFLEAIHTGEGSYHNPVTGHDTF